MNRLLITRDTASQILDRWEAVHLKLRQQSAWFVMLRLAAQPDWCSVHVLCAANPKARETARIFLRRLHKRGMVDIRTTNKNWRLGEPVLHYKLTQAGFAFLNTGL